MKINTFEDIETWKEARLLVTDIYACFSRVKDYSFRDQIQRAGLSVMCNIAEGFDRGTNREFVQFLIIARGSVSEVRSLAYAALDIGYINEHTFECLVGRCSSLSKMINGFIRYLKNSPRFR